MNWRQLHLSFWHVLQWGGVALLMAVGVGTAAPIEQQLAAIRKTSPELHWNALQLQAQLAELDDTISKYFAFYGLDLPCAQHRFGYVDAGGKRIATHVFVPDGEVRGTVVAVHGYLDHTATWRHAIRELLATGFAVIIYDQPGHGLSSGPQASIGDFSEYVAVLQAMVNSAREHLPAPCHLAAHSMGCAISVDYLLSSSDADCIDKVVLTAPLVRSNHWRLSNGGSWLAKPFVDTVPRKFRNNSSDKAYLEFVKRDPLHARHLPLAWTDSLRRWNTRAEKFKASSRPVLIIQGDRDRTVDAKYNLPFLKRLFPNSRAIMIKGGGHQLLNETESLKRKTLEAMSSFLKEGTP